MARRGTSRHREAAHRRCGREAYGREAARTGPREREGEVRARNREVSSNLKYGTSILFIHNATKLLPSNEIEEKNSAFTERDNTLHVHDLEIGADDWNPLDREALWITAITQPSPCLRRRRGYIYQ
ncbi:hypothetical protein [Streptosporangium vulgare]|uniref:Uncharacterized protein n=1 Tax=Streptosporangium vulgare TaxID=46190 RepID=A0ABV5TJ99_9ACTN